mmetsp:Transcript_21026/g.58229  ORF Transcript_21026/g.58229 Transcript_21026/m.58229 type:complete len:211 (-) Transcript_21026:791-1423(-)
MLTAGQEGIQKGTPLGQGFKRGGRQQGLAKANHQIHALQEALKLKGRQFAMIGKGTRSIAVAVVVVVVVGGSVVVVVAVQKARGVQVQSHPEQLFQNGRRKGAAFAQQKDIGLTLLPGRFGLSSGQDLGMRQKGRPHVSTGRQSVVVVGRDGQQGARIALATAAPPIQPATFAKDVGIVQRSPRVMRSAIGHDAVHVGFGKDGGRGGLWC